MADTMADSTATEDQPTPPDLKPPALSIQVPASPSRVAPVVAGFVAARAVHLLSDIPVGTLSMTLLSTGFALVGRRGKAKIGLACIGAAGALIVRAQRSAAATEFDLREDRRNLT